VACRSSKMLVLMNTLDSFGAGADEDEDEDEDEEEAGK
jgi:hypothetical protein